MSPMAVFLTISLCCAFFFVLTAAFGGDTSGADIDTNLDVSTDQETGVATSNFLTLRNIFLFGVGFGSAGAISSYLGNNTLISSFWGVGAGVLMAIVAAWLYRVVRRQESNTVANHESLEGQHARVITSIPENGFGEVSAFNQFGATVNLAAQSQDGATPVGSSVEIVTIAGNTAIVKRI